MKDPFSVYVCLTVLWNTSSVKCVGKSCLRRGWADSLSRACVFWIQTWESLTQNCVHMRQRKKLYLNVIQINRMKCYLIWRDFNKKLNRKTPQKQHKKTCTTIPNEAKKTVTRNIMASTFTLFGSNTVLFYVPVTLRTRSSAKWRAPYPSVPLLRLPTHKYWGTHICKC